jgi:hypothetical protein
VRSFAAREEPRHRALALLLERCRLYGPDIKGGEGRGTVRDDRDRNDQAHDGEQNLRARYTISQDEECQKERVQTTRAEPPDERSRRAADRRIPFDLDVTKARLRP